MCSKKQIISSILLLICLIASHSGVQAQLPMATNFNNAYAKHTRSLSGEPGVNYWQNTADYHIQIKFDPETRLLTGHVGIDYQNNSPDTLKEIVFKLYPNLYQQQAMRNMIIAPADLTKGVEVDSLQINGKIVAKAKLLIRGTNMYCPRVLIVPGGKTHFDITFSYALNKGSFIRTGEVDTGAFVIAYFFPRIAVYDDMDGWNEYPYMGKEEFYNDFCNFDVDITLPGNYQCWATGNLQNTAAVYEPQIAKRIIQAAENDSVTNVITVADIKAGHITKSNPTNTWKFKAENVTDFTFAISNHYVWQASSVLVDPKTGRRTRIDAVYNPEHKAYLPVINYGRQAVELISYKIPAIPFPYPHETVFEGLDAMEYPMMVNNLPFEKKDEAIELTVHEIFHALFPFFVGSNETKYSFMDEGWATFSEFSITPFIAPEFSETYNITDVNKSAGADQDVPVMTLTPQLYGKARFSDKDLKPALGFHYIREMLGDSLFFKAVRYYVSEWNGKHPNPYDFFYCMNKGAGRNMDWFWKNWFFEKNVPDLAISRVKKINNQYQIVVANVGTEIVPVHLTMYYQDGTKQSVSFSIACWAKGNRSVTATVGAGKKMIKVVLGKPYDVDVNPGNNVWTASL